MTSRGRGDGLFEELLALRGGWASGCCPLVSNAVVAEENGEPRPREWVELAGYRGTATFAFGILLEGGCNMRKGIAVVSPTIVYMMGRRKKDTRGKGTTVIIER